MFKEMLVALALGVAVAVSAGAAAAGDAGNGEAVFKKKCKACHTLVEGGKHKMGPNLFGIIGATAGSTDFAKYKQLKDSDVVWSVETLDLFLADPSGFAGGKVNMKSLTDGTLRADLIAYLKTVQ